jgi:ATP-dependent 26S proteasome regulatory subunit
MQVKNYLSNNGQYYANEGSNSIPKLPSGSYQLQMNEMTGQFYFEEKKMNYDQLIDLPSSEYDQVMQEIDTFLKPNTKSKFADMGFLYKRSALLYGLPGAGKTCIVNRVSEKVIAK